MQGIKKARKPPNKPATKVSHKVFSCSVVLRFAVFAMALSAVSFALTTAESASFIALSVTADVSGPISVNSRSFNALSVSCA
ncbi:hypothetical protein D3C85_1389320 [compost metagenome]